MLYYKKIFFQRTNPQNLQQHHKQNPKKAESIRLSVRLPLACSGIGHNQHQVSYECQEQISDQPENYLQ